jgi:hypothetical protein
MKMHRRLLTAARAGAALAGAFTAAAAATVVLLYPVVEQWEPAAHWLAAMVWAG